MLKTEKEKKLCDKYSKRDINGFVHCLECTLRVYSEENSYACKENSHYDKKLKEWVSD